MKRPRSPYEELTDSANQNVLGTLTGRSWNLMQTNRVRAEMMRIGRLVERMPDEQLPDMPSPLEALMNLGMRTSGSIGGKHREDLREAVKGMQSPKMGLVAQLPEPEGDVHGI